MKSGGIIVNDKENADVLKGTALEIYRYMLTNPKPVGIRETQRALNLSSPTLAKYNLTKLEKAGLVKKENESYAVKQGVT